MTGFVVVGTDTDAGKTAFSLLFLAAFPDAFAYWKPVETGESDAEKVRRLVPRAVVLPPLARFAEPVAPVLAARREGRPMPGVADVLSARPVCDRTLLIETFGGPLSPLTDDVLQLDLIRAFALPVVLVASSAVGAVGRVLQAAAALAQADIRPVAVVLLGAEDPFAREQLVPRLGGAFVGGVELPAGGWTPEAITATAGRARSPLWWVDNAVRNPQTFIGRPPDFAAADARAVWHPYTPLQTPDAPLPVVAADDEFLTLADGRRLIDGISSWWTILHGHRPPSIMQAIRDATHRLDHVLFAGATHPAAAELAAALLGSMPWGPGGRVFYSDNGSTAVEVALKMAYQAWCHRGEPGRTLFIGFEDGYHGDTFGAMSVGRDPVFFGRFDPLLFRALRVPLSAEALDTVLTRHANAVAAVIVEPLVQGAGGIVLHTPAELRALFDVARRHGVYFVADEVMTGFGRTGTLWAFEQAGIAPDLVCAAKGLSGGVLPLAATLAAPAVVAEFDSPDRTRTLFHGHSFTANPIACAAGAASWELLAAGHWRADVRRIEAHLRSALGPLAAWSAVKGVRVCGTFGAVELDVPGGYLADVGRRLRHACLDRGVLVRPLGAVLYAFPPYCTSDDSLGRITDAMTHAVRTCGL